MTFPSLTLRHGYIQNVCFFKNTFLQVESFIALNNFFLTVLIQTFLMMLKLLNLFLNSPKHSRSGLVLEVTMSQPKLHSQLLFLIKKILYARNERNCFKLIKDVCQKLMARILLICETVILSSLKQGTRRAAHSNHHA